MDMFYEPESEGDISRETMKTTYETLRKLLLTGSELCIAIKPDGSEVQYEGPLVGIIEENSPQQVKINAHYLNLKKEYTY